MTWVKETFGNVLFAIGALAWVATGQELCEAVSCTYCQMARALQPEVCGPPLGAT